MSGGDAIRYGLELALVVTVEQHAHWSVALAVGVLFLGMEALARNVSRLLR